MIGINKEVSEMAFVYHKDGKIKVLPYEDAKENQPYLIDNGWKHTATLNACVFIEYLCKLDDADILKSIKELKL